MFDASKITPDNWQGFQYYPSMAAACCQMYLPEGFWVNGPHGPEFGSPGDYLILTDDGRRMVRSKEYVERPLGEEVE